MIMLMKTLATVALALLFSFAPALAQDAKPAVDPDALAAAKELMEATGTAKQIDGMIASVTKGVAAGAAGAGGDKAKQVGAEFDEMMKKFAGYKAEMMNDFAVLYAQTFTAAEMREVANFYKSGTGAKFISAMPVLMQKGAEIGMKYSQRLMQEAGGKK